GGNRSPLGDQESISGDAERGVMVEAPPSSALIVSEPEFLFELLIIALDAPAQLGEIDQAFEGDVSCQRRAPIFGRLVRALGPLDQQPFFTLPLAAMGGAHAQTRKARRQSLGGGLAPADRAPGALGQAQGEVLDRDGPVLGVPAGARRPAAPRPPTPRGERGPGAAPPPGGRSSAAGHGPTTASAAAAPCRAPTPWCSTKCRRHTSVPGC